MSFTYQYPRPALSADCVLFAWHQSAIHVLLIRRKHEPFADCWALPGGFVDIDEDLEPAASRELEEETGIKRIALRQLNAYGKVDRDPRTRVVTVAFWGMVTKSQMRQATAGDDAAETRWHRFSDLPELAFDHKNILVDARKSLRNLATFHCLGKEWLPKEFSVAALKEIYQAALLDNVSKTKLVRQLTQAGVLIENGEAGTYAFDSRRYRRFQVEPILRPWS